MAEIGGTNALFRHLLDDFTESGDKVARLGASLGWDWKTNRLPVNDWEKGNCQQRYPIPFC